MVGACWTPNPTLAIATYFFTANGKFQLSLNIGDHLQIEEETENWYKGYSIKSATTSANRIGIFPKTFVKVHTCGNPATDTDVVLNQLHQLMAEWAAMFKTCIQEGKAAQYHRVKERMAVLLEMRRQVMAPNTPLEVQETLKEKLLDKIKDVQEIMGQDITPKNANGQFVDESNTGSVVALYHTYQERDEEYYKRNNQSNHFRSPVDVKKVQQLVKRDELRKSVAIVRTQLLGVPPQSTVGKESKSNFVGRVATNILLDLKILMCPVGEATELHFSLYNYTSNLFVSEEYQVKMTSKGMPQDLNQLGKLKTVFSNVNQQDLQNGVMYLVLRLIRTIADTNDVLKRPFGVAVLPLTCKGGDTALVLGKEVEHIVPVFAAANESLFSVLHELIVKNEFQVTKNGPLLDIPNSKGVVLGLTLLQGESPSLPIAEGVSITSQLSLVHDTPLPLSYFRNDIHFTLLNGDFIKDKTASNKNVQVVVSLRDSNGNIIDSIYDGCPCGVRTVESVVLLHNNNPTWNESFSLKFTAMPIVSLDFLKDKWICMQMYHCAVEKGKEKEEFAHAFLPLSKLDGTVIDDGVHSVCTFKPQPTLVPTYSLQEEAKLNIRKGETIRLRLQLASTALTSNSFVFQLLTWKKQNSPLEDILKKFSYIKPAEIIKFLRDILETLFEIMETRGGGDELLLLAFDAFLFTVTLPNTAILLDQYLADHSKHLNLRKKLLYCLKYYLSATTPDSSSKLITTLKSVAHIVKFIIASTSSKDDSLKKDIVGVIDMIKEIMSNTSPLLRGPQSTALKNISLIFGDLAKLFSVVELSTIISQFINAVQYSPLYELLNKDKLMLLNKLVCSPLFFETNALEILLPTVLTQLDIHLRGTNHDEILQCVLILSVITNAFQVKSKVGPCVQQVLTQLPGVIGAVRALCNEPDIAREPFICLLAMLKLPSRVAFERYLGSLGGLDAQRAFLVDLFTLLYDILSGPAQPSSSQIDAATGILFPSRWLLVNMAAYGIVLRLLDHMSEYFINMLYNAEWTFAPCKALWERVLGVAVLFMGARSLALESFAPIKRNLVVDRYGDMRQLMSKVLFRLWEALSTQDQMTLLSSMVGPALHLFMMKFPLLQESGSRLYSRLLEVEVAQSCSIKVVESLTINKLDECACNATIPQHFGTLFASKLESNLTSNDDILATKVTKLAVDVTYLLDHLTCLSSLPQTSVYEEERIDAVVKLMDFLKASGQTALYLKYVHMLESMHVTSGNFGEAGYTVLLHANLFKFDDESVAPIGVFPQYFLETAWQRKERLYKLAIDYFDKGMLWETAIKLIKELRILYEHSLFDYDKLSVMLSLQAGLTRKISTVERFFPDYFLVGYYGQGFDTKYKNKVFIFRGNELERRADFVERIQARFPNSSVLPYTDPPSNDIINSNAQYLQVFNVKTLLDTNETVNPSMPSSIKRFYQLHNRNVFVYNKPFRKNKHQDTNEFKSLWLRNYMYHTAVKLPSTHRRTEVIHQEEVEVSPINLAVKTMSDKNSEIADMNRKYGPNATDHNIKNFSPFTMILKGSIDAAVSGGIERYNDAFFDPSYIIENGSDIGAVQQLKELCVAHVLLLEKGLASHAQMCGPALLPLQQQLDVQFVMMKTHVLSYINK